MPDFMRKHGVGQFRYRQTLQISGVVQQVTNLMISRSSHRPDIGSNGREIGGIPAIFQNVLNLSV
ncbi:MAG: hypothetical protein DA408_18445 [Bacteroidetes bacterium]|nr:MAG: hypothetical protein C7N36_21615 [Bacteroidota bacterium]PTM09406.1 MAG: hypothetical protein DA408_18445 [Bacteroidota bacterium]